METSNSGHSFPRGQIPICELKKDTSFYVCYEHEGVIKSLIKCWYNKHADFFFYPVVSDYEASMRSETGVEGTISKAAEKSHPRITIHQSGVVVGPDKYQRQFGHSYNRLKSSIKTAKDGVRLASHHLGVPDIYQNLSEKQRKRGTWFHFIPIGSDIRPIISIDAYPLFDVADISRISASKDYISGFITRPYKNDYRVLILFELREEANTPLGGEHFVYIPVHS